MLLESDALDLVVSRWFDGRTVARKRGRTPRWELSRIEWDERLVRGETQPGVAENRDNHHPPANKSPTTNRALCCARPPSAYVAGGAQP